MKISDVANYLKSIFKIKDQRNNLSNEEIIALDYYECISYLYKEKEKPIILGFNEGVNIWLNTSVGPIELDSIPHNNGHLTNNVQEIEVLIGENDYDEKFIISLINKKIDECWNR